MRTRMCTKIDERLETTQEALSAIKTIKLYSWEKFFVDRITKARKQEIKTMYGLYYLNGGQFPECIMFMAEVVASSKRIMDFLNLPETETPSQDICSTEAKVTCKNVDVAFDKTILENINLTISTGITFVTGPKSQWKKYSFKVNTSRTSTFQWYYPNTRKNLIRVARSLALPFIHQTEHSVPGRVNDLRYQKVLKVCALEYDLKLLPDKDATIVEDRGIKLSKGQQARINLARAVYKNADIYLLDDCLSALDNQVGDFIFEECIRKFLQNKVVILVSHNSRYLKKVDQVLMVESGNVKPVKLLEILEKYKDVTEDLHLEHEILRKNVRERKVYQEISKKGEIKSEVYKKYLHFSGGVGSLVAILLSYGVAQFVVSYPDKLLSEWVNLEQKLSNFTSHNDTLDDIVAETASLNLHKHMITNVLNATMHFFDSTFIARSPVIGYFHASLDGSLTIKAQSILRNEFDRHQNVYTSASYIFQCSMKSFAFYVNILCTVFIAIVVARFVFSDEEFAAGNVGLAISQALRMTSILQWGVRMENFMTSVEQALEYGEVKQKPKKGQIQDNWPKKGEIQYSNVSLSYNESNDYILKEILNVITLLLPHDGQYELNNKVRPCEESDDVLIYDFIVPIGNFDTMGLS
ncbi:ATP-binding cassette sub-family C member 4-like [Zophobas morio]|uniref:ATP-binding cassette sub-family C member 4-like n=1 Tax=Zophobas morio TaxID=2755281 RepID=UPI003083B4C5